MANEGKVLGIVKAEDSDKLVKAMKTHELGKKAQVIGEVSDQVKGVYVKTRIGSMRPLPMIEADPLPRIC